jgi:glycosyltransferase involved in cell wall biosynthesis
MKNFSNNLKKVSVVIATLGESTLKLTIDSLNSGTLKPSEILVCVPHVGNIKLDISKFDNVKVVECCCFGQVLQRIEGFKLVKHELVMQIDSDIQVDVNCLENLVRAMDCLPDKSSISPYPEIIYYSAQNKGFSYFLFKKCLAYKWKDNAIGKIKRSCKITNPYKNREENLSKTEWVNGIAMHRRGNLILDNYYPFTGKAYYEDVIHSIMLRRLGISLWVCQNAKIKHLGDALSEYATPKECLRYFKKILLIRFHILNINGGSLLWMLLVWGFDFLYSIFKTLFFSKYLHEIKKESI